MYKGIIIAGVLLLIIIVALPAGFGYLATSRFQHLLDSVNESGDVKFEVVRRERGWLVTDYLLHVRLSSHYQQSLAQSGKLANASPAMYVRSTLHHGPFPLSGDVAPFTVMVAHVNHQWIDSPETNRAIDLFDYTFTTDLHFDGSQQIHIDIHSLDKPLLVGQMQFDWRDITARFDLNEDVSEVLMAVKIPFLQWSTAKSQLLIETFLLDAEMKKGIEGLMLGSTILSVDRLLARDSASELDFFIKDVNMHTESKARQSTIDVHASIKMNNLGFADERFGKGEFNLVFRNLDAGVLARLTSKFRELSSQGPLPEQQAKILVGTTLLMEMTKFLQSGPELELVALRLEGEQDSLDGYAKLAVDNSQASLLSNPFLAKDSIKANVRLVIPESLLVSYHTAQLRLEHARARLKTVSPRLRELAMERVKNSLAPFVATEMLRYADHKYQFDASLMRGKWLVNGKPLYISPTVGLAP